MIYKATQEFIHAIGHYKKGDVIQRTTGAHLKSLKAKGLIAAQDEEKEVKKVTKKK